MTLIHALTSLYGLGTAKKADQYGAVDVKFVAKPKARWYESRDVTFMERNPIISGGSRGFMGKRKIC
jgi:hypothetical protein